MKNNTNILFQTVVTSKGSLQSKEIESVAKLKTYRRSAAGQKCEEHSEIIYRNSLLFTAFPNVNWAILQIPGAVGNQPNQNPDFLNPFMVDGQEFRLDLASNSRLAKEFVNRQGKVDWGSFTFSSHPGAFRLGVGPLLFGLKRAEYWKRIIYGSIVHTGCRKLIAANLNFVISDDEQQPDDPTNGIQWNSGDSHAKSGRTLFQLLRLDPNYLADNEPSDWHGEPLERPLQFRTLLQPPKISDGKVSQLGVIGKGTFDYTDQVDNSNFDLIMPLSSLKGNKLPLGNYQERVLMGYVFEAEQRIAKTGWMFFQHFKWSVLEADGIIQGTIDKCTELAAAYNSVAGLCKILRIDYADRKQNHENYSEEEVGNLEEYEDKFLKVVESDRSGKLFNHPYVIENIKQRLRKQWLTLAKSGGVRFYSFMTMPDESLAHYNVWDDPIEKNFCLDGRVCCCSDLEEGEYILFVNPMRHWGDVQTWENKHEGQYVERSGIVAAPNKLFLTLGRDFDGDFVQMLHVEEYPAIAEEIRQFQLPPKVRKLPKEQITGHIQEIAINSMSNYTGLIAFLLGVTVANNLSYRPFVVPVGGIYSEEQEMYTIEFLSQELQIAVDSLKSATPNNKVGIDKMIEDYKSENLSIPWQSGFKDPEVYKSKLCPVDESHEDTISKLVQLVNSQWVEAKIPQTIAPRNFINTLFSDISFTDLQGIEAKKVRDQYRKLMAEAIAYKQKTESSRKLSEVLDYFQNEKQRVLAIPNPKTGNLYDHYSWVSAFWNVAHQADTGRAGLAFNFFIEEICEALEDASISYRDILIYGCQFQALGDFTPYHDTIIDVRFVQKEKMIALRKEKQPDGSWDWQRNPDGSIKKAPQYRAFAEYLLDDGEWQTLGYVAGQYLHNVPEMPLNGSPSIDQEMKVFVAKEIDTYGVIETSQVLLLPKNVRTELGEAEVDLIQRGIQRTTRRFFWYIWWMSDSGYLHEDIKTLVPEWNHPKMLDWVNSRGLKYPWS